MKLSQLQSKIYYSPHSSYLKSPLPVKRDKNRIVFTNGCFDILHEGHIASLLYASNLGDSLIVGLNSDASVRQLKGLGRPIVPQSSRSLILASFIFVDLVIIFDELTPHKLLTYLDPDVIVKGSDYLESDVVKHSDDVHIFLSPLIPNLSTTFLLQRYISSSNITSPF